MTNADTNKKVLVKFRGCSPLIFTVPESRVSTLATMADVEWVSTTDATQYFTGVVVKGTLVSLTPDAMRKVVEFLRDNHKIRAIREVRLEKNCPLKEAKDFVDALEFALNQQFGDARSYPFDDGYYPDDAPF